MAGHVEVSSYDIRRLAKHLGMGPAQFEREHIVEVTRRGKKRIKSGDDTCQFLAADRTCTVYAARPTNCRGYVCWEDDDEVYEWAKFLQLPIAAQRKLEQK